MCLCAGGQVSPERAQSLKANIVSITESRQSSLTIIRPSLYHRRCIVLLRRNQSSRCFRCNSPHSSLSRLRGQRHSKTIGSPPPERVHWTSIHDTPRHQEGMPLLCGSLHGPPIPGASVLTRPLNHIKVSIFRSCFTYNLTPRAVILTGVLEHIQVSIPCSVFCRRLIPRAAL